MDDCCGGGLHGRAFGRRHLFRGSLYLALGLSMALPPRALASATPGSGRLGDLPIHSRSDWAGDSAPLGALKAEPDVRFLLVHHTVSGNTYDPGDVPSLLRSFYRLHTGPNKNWPDVAYNFFVDRFGGVWEGRSGSLAGPVQADATGGSQGFAQLCCFIGDHQVEAPTKDAQAAMSRLLAALADRYEVDTSPGATTSFQSRGSNRWPQGASVTVSTIAGHRDVSRTECPGDAAYEFVTEQLPQAVSALRRPAASGQTATPSPTPSSAPLTVASAPPSASAVAPIPAASAVANEPDDLLRTAALAAGGVAATGTLAAVGLLARRRRGRLAPAAALPYAASTAPQASPPTHVAASGWTAFTARSLTRAEVGSEAVLVAAAVERCGDLLLGCLVQAATPTPAVRAAVAAVRKATRTADTKHGAQPTPAQLVADALRATDRAEAPERAGLEIAVVVMRNGRCSLATTNAALGALVTRQGAVYSPRFSRSAKDKRVQQAQCATDELAVALLSSAVGADGRPATPAELAAPSLATAMLAAPTPRRLLDAQLRRFARERGTDATVVAIVPPAPADTPY